MSGTTTPDWTQAPTEQNTHGLRSIDPFKKERELRGEVIADGV